MRASLLAVCPREAFDMLVRGVSTWEGLVESGAIPTIATIPGFDDVRVPDWVHDIACDRDEDEREDRC